jgi:NDP-sugar pyrophosphorylase family protein
MQLVTEHVPKILIPANGKPFAHHQLSWLADQGLARIIYGLGHIADQVMD